jgi:hypothetical protein
LQVLGTAVHRVTVDEVVPGAFWDSAALLVMTLAQLVLAGWLALRERRRAAPEPRASDSRASRSRR